MSRFTLALVSVVLLLSGGQAVGDEVAVGSAVAWLKSFPNVPPIPDGWVECNGQVLDDPNSSLNGETIPDLNGEAGTQRFLRGSTSSGTIGGTESHSHKIDSGGGDQWTWRVHGTTSTGYEGIIKSSGGNSPQAWMKETTNAIAVLPS